MLKLARSSSTFASAGSLQRANGTQSRRLQNKLWNYLLRLAIRRELNSNAQGSSYAVKDRSAASFLRFGADVHCQFISSQWHLIIVGVTAR